MDSDNGEFKKLKIFFSYSSKDKKFAGLLREYLLKYDFDCFMAHDDIEPLADWIEVIKKNLNSCDIFILIITNNFKESDWTDQETGWAKATDKFIVPLQVDLPPYGFINHIQGLLVKQSMLENDTYVMNLSYKIVTLIEKEPIIKSKIDNYFIFKIIKMLSNSSSFDDANATSQLLEKYPNFTTDHVRLLYQATKNNNQIQGAFKTQKILKEIFKKYKENLKEEEYTEIIELLSV